MGQAVMRRLRMVGLGLACAVVATAVLAGTAPAFEYGLKSLPEFGRCVRLTTKTGNWAGAHCVHHEPGKGHYEWLPGPDTAKKKFTDQIMAPGFETTGTTRVLVTCSSGTAEGEYTGEKTVTVTKLVLVMCKNPAVSGYKTWCQKELSATGEIEGTGLPGELGFIAKAKTWVGLDLKGPIAFECEGAVEGTMKGSGTGTKRELVGSVIGRITRVDRMVLGFAVKDEVKHGVQFPEKFEAGEKDTLMTLVGVAKTSEPTVLSAFHGLKNEQPLEIKAKCVGTGC
jgi:hypothetical protein